VALAVELTGIILCGGRGQRMGGQDKGLLTLHNKTLVQHAIEKLQPHAHTILISANRHLDRYQQFGFPVIPDTSPEFLGPVAGIAATLAQCTTPWAMVVPCDAPNWPSDLPARLYHKAIDEQRSAATVWDGARIQPGFSLVPASAHAAAQQALVEKQLRLATFIQQLNPAHLDCSNQAHLFANINTPDDYQNLATR
jgi:molybdenum cofactor guanylyltransferase